MQAVRDDGRKLFRRMSEKEIDTALAARDPAYVFQAVEQSPVFGFQDGWPAGGGWTTENSFLRAPENLLSTMVVVDSSAISGLSPVQIADYVTLRLLAPTGEVAAADPAAPQTILSLFAMPETAHLSAHPLQDAAHGLCRRGSGGNSAGRSEVISRF